MYISTILIALLGGCSALMATDGASSANARIVQATQEKSLAIRETSADQVATLQKQITALQKQLVDVAKQVSAQDQKSKRVESIKESKAHEVVLKEEPKKADAPVFDPGYMAVPGTNAGIKFSGVVKLDAIYDAKTNTSEQSGVHRLPYDRLVNANIQTRDANWNKHFYMHAKQTKFRIDSIVKSPSGRDVKAFIEADFFGTTNWGDTASPSGATFTSTPVSTTYQLRLRHAVLSYAGLEAGHTMTTFHAEEAVLPSVDFNGIHGSYNRHALVRYTQKFGNFSLSGAAEHSRTDYVMFRNLAATDKYSYFAQDAVGTTNPGAAAAGSNLSKPQMPDLIMRLKYNFANGSMVSLSGLYRDLRIKNNTQPNAAGADGRVYTANGFGANLAAKIMTVGKSFFSGGIIAGKGIGWYIDEANGRSAFFDPTNADIGKRVYKAVPMTMFWAGYSQVWAPQWESNIGIARIGFDTQSLNANTNKTTTISTTESGIDRTFNKFLINTIYKPEGNLQFGLEYFLLQRKSNTAETGSGQRVQFGASYKF